MKKSIRKFLLPSVITSASILPMAIGLISSQCTTDSNVEAIKTQGYADAMQKLANKSITVAGAWSDARFYAKDHANDLEVIGATSHISNDGVQARSDLKLGDIKALQQLLIAAIKESNKQVKDNKDSNKESNLTYLDKNNKIQSIFKIYNHDGYAPVGFDANIVYNINGDSKKAYEVIPKGDSEYISFDEKTSKFTTVDEKKNLKIQFIPSSDAALVQKATEKLQLWIKEKGIKNIEISVSSDYNSAATALKAKSIDVAFLPVDTWAKLSGDSSFIIQAGRNVQIIDPYISKQNPSTPKFNDEKLLVEAFNNYKIFNKNNLYINKEPSKNPNSTANGYNDELKTHIDSLATGEELPTVGFYRSYIYVRKDSEIYKIVIKALKEQGSNWKLKWSEVRDYVIYGYTSTTSAASYIYPEQWFKKHFEGFKSFLE
ncbi:hypothetical protein ACWXVM_00745 [Mycoplasma sp. 2261]